MFEQLKQMKKLKQMQDSFKKERFEVENQGIRVVINGNLEVQEIYLNQDLDKSSQEQILKQCLNEVAKKAQMALAKQLF
ncbi:MAG: YbaB/EbfC family nucleoid-associated protein [Candidatus Pacebacteria bacterium]|nr:YbaB/EbfC family nucleoid-associated protein [Candidatus Paceibacterota bacterium]